MCRTHLSDLEVLILVIGGLTHDKLLIMRGSSTPKRGKSTSDNRKPIRSPVRLDELASVTDGYRLWLARQPLSVDTRRTYLGRVRQYCAYLETSANDYGDPLSDPHARDYAIRDFKSHLKKERKAKPASVNLMLAALDHLYLFLGLGRPKVRREDLPQEAPRPSKNIRVTRGKVALNVAVRQQRHLLRWPTSGSCRAEKSRRESRERR